MSFSKKNLQKQSKSDIRKNITIYNSYVWIPIQLPLSSCQVFIWYFRINNFWRNSPDSSSNFLKVPFQQGKAKWWEDASKLHLHTSRFHMKHISYIEKKIINLLRILPRFYLYCNLIFNFNFISSFCKLFVNFKNSWVDKKVWNISK